MKLLFPALLTIIPCVAQDSPWSDPPLFTSDTTSHPNQGVTPSPLSTGDSPAAIPIQKSPTMKRTLDFGKFKTQQKVRPLTKEEQQKRPGTPFSLTEEEPTPYGVDKE